MSTLHHGHAAPRLCAGLDIGGSKVSAVAVDGTGRVHAQARVATSRGPAGVVDSAAAAIAELRRQLPLASVALAAVGVGVPGLVDPSRGLVTHAVNLGLGADGLALADLLRDRLGVPVTVENDVNVAALGAAALGALGPAPAGAADLAYLSIGTGLAAGLVLAGRLRRGSRGAAGEIGHIPLDPAGPQCRCGQRGCAEMLASGAAIAASWPDGDGGSAAASLFAAAAGGDPVAVRVRDTVAGHLASLVRLLVLTVDVDVVVLGGGVGEVGEPLRAAVAAALVRQAEGSALLRDLSLADRLALVPAGEPVAAVGAALLCDTEMSTEPGTPADGTLRPSIARGAGA
jgi:glucokinase